MFSSSTLQNCRSTCLRVVVMPGLQASITSPLVAPSSCCVRSGHTLANHVDPWAEPSGGCCKHLGEYSLILDDPPISTRRPFRCTRRATSIDTGTRLLQRGGKTPVMCLKGRTSGSFSEVWPFTASSSSHQSYRSSVPLVPRSWREDSGFVPAQLLTHFKNIHARMTLAILK